MRVNRSTFDKVKAQYEIKKMSAAYINAEKMIMANPSLTGFDQAHNIAMESLSVQKMDPEQFYAIEMDGFGNAKSLTVKDMQMRELESKLESMEDKGRQLLKEEKYEEFAELKDWYDNTLRQLNKLRGNS